MDNMQAALALLSIASVIWARKRSIPIHGILGCALVASMFPPPYQTWQELVVWIMALDAFVCIGCYFIWAKTVDMRAYCIGVIGLAKNVGSFILLTTPNYFPWGLFAAGINLAYVLQILCAGGYLNAVGSWLDDCLLRFAPKRHSLLRNGL